MPISTLTSRDDVYPRRPLKSQKNAGGDMSIMCFARPRSPRRFASPEQHQIKGLNVETVAGILFPPPAWITSPEYSTLRADSEDDDPDRAFFSLNLSITTRHSFRPNGTTCGSLCTAVFTPMLLLGRSSQTMLWRLAIICKITPFRHSSFATKAINRESIISSLWHEMTLTDIFYSITPRMFDMTDNFPVIPPIVSFTGPIVGSGRTLLHDEGISGVGDTQRKCCGFVQLSTYLVPGNPTKTPF